MLPSGASQSSESAACEIFISIISHLEKCGFLTDHLAMPSDGDDQIGIKRLSYMVRKGCSGGETESCRVKKKKMPAAAT